MGASASVSLIPLRPEFDLDTIQDVVGDDAWIPAYEKQFEAAASARGSASASTSTSANNKPTVSYEQFVALYQRNLLAQTPPVGLLRNLLKKFQKILSGKGSEEADAAVRAERERREAEALSVPWDCPVCSVASQSGAECGICASDNPKLAAIRAEESNLAAEAPITERDVATVEILLEKVQSLEESVISMAGFLKSVGREDVVAGGARALSGEGGMTVKLRLLQSQQDSLHRKSLEKQLLADDIRRCVFRGPPPGFDSPSHDTTYMHIHTYKHTHMHANNGRCCLAEGVSCHLLSAFFFQIRRNPEHFDRSRQPCDSCTHAGCKNVFGKKTRTRGP